MRAGRMMSETASVPTIGLNASDEKELTTPEEVHVME